jgi:hypothetical protein
LELCWSYVCSCCMLVAVRLGNNEARLLELCCSSVCSCCMLVAARLGNNEARLLERIAVAYAAAGQIKLLQLLQLPDRDCTHTHTHTHKTHTRAHVLYLRSSQRVGQSLSSLRPQ